VALLTSSIALFGWALASFGSSWRVGIDQESPGSLVTRGVFAYTRNPIFVSMDTFFIGTFFVQGTVFFLAAAIIAVAATHFQILQEETFLARTYGSDYQRYRTAVPRYLGLPSRTSAAA
jgi:protein-S-isoprenylcysteine O-methyltransferase Ste14